VKAANNDAIVMSFPIAAFGKEPGKEKAAEKEKEAEEEEAPETAPPPKEAAKDAAKPAGAKDGSKDAAAKPARPVVRDYKETGKEPSIIIDVTRLFTSDVFELSARQRLNANMMDASRSYIERVSPYPENIEVEATHTYTRAATPTGAPRTATPFGAAGMRPGSATVVLHHSMVKLPEHPMTPRLFDERVGYFSVRQMDYGRDEQRAPKRIYITRWRLEKKDPSAALSEPVKPIVYYIDAATPTKWVPYMKAGVESWQKAFEAAGFKNAIVAKPAPTPREDPEYSPEDVRYSVIRWLPSTVENAVGPHISDPRTGEILNADIQFYHNVMNLQRDWYFLQVGPLDPRAQKAAAAGRSHGPPGRICLRARSRPHAWLPTQYEGQLPLSAGEDPGQRVAQENGPHAFHHGLLPLQLCCAARGRHRSGRPGAYRGTVRCLGHPVGLLAHRLRQDG
jgi:hypothetical protein